MELRKAADNFIDACANANLELANQIVLQHPNINMVYYLSETGTFRTTEIAFMHSCEIECLDVMKWLYEKWKNVFTNYVKQKVFLNSCACFDNKNNMAEFLLLTGDNIFVNNAKAFKEACFHKNLYVAELFCNIRPFKYKIVIKSYYKKQFDKILCSNKIITDESHVRTTIEGIVNTNKTTKLLELLYMFCKKSYTPTPAVMFNLQRLSN